ncbi:MAG: hypothetical protein QOE92_1603 [Chloroflexota bacterium]|nr:hypothetical protein [Chloroflexota bacterium]
MAGMSEPEEPRKSRAEWVDDLRRPARVLIYLLILATVLQVYKDIEFIMTRVFSVLLLFVFAAIIAMLLNPLVDRVETFGPLKGRRGIAVLVVNVTILLLLAAFLAVLIPNVASQGAGLATSAPHIFADVQAAMSDWEIGLNNAGIPLHVAVPTNLEGLVAPALGSAVSVLTGTLGALVNILLLTVIAIYLQIEGRQIIAALRQVFPQQQALFDFSLVAAGSTLAGYVRGQVIIAVIITVLSGVALTVIGVKFALVVAVITFFLELIPLVGAPIAMAVAVGVALPQGPVVIGLTAGATLVIHTVVAYTIGLKVIGNSTRIHPLVAMAALVLGAQLGGVLGALFAIPIAGILNVYMGALYRARRGGEAFELTTDAGMSSSEALEALPNLGEEITQMAEDSDIAREPIPTATPKRRKRAAASKA